MPTRPITPARGSAPATGAPAPRRGGVRLPEPARRTALRAALAAAAGGVQLLALPPYGLWVLAPLAPALLLVAVYGTTARRAAWLGAVAGASLMVPLFYWQQLFGVDVWLVMAAVETLYYIPMAMGIAVACRWRGWVVVSSALWVAQELVRSRWPFDGFAWAKLAYAQPDTPFAGYAALGSSPLVSFMVALCGALLAAVALRWRRDRAWRAAVRTAAPAFAVIALVLLGGLVAPRIGAPEVDRTVAVGIVQGDAPAVRQLDILVESGRMFDNHMAGVERLAEQVRQGDAPRPDLVILPENATDIDPYVDPSVARRIEEAAASVDAPLILGVSHHISEDEREVRAVVWEEQDGPGEYYVKRHPVPFGEYIPYRDLVASLISRLQWVGADAVRGTEPGALEAGGTTVATGICFDVAFDPPMREAVLAGGEILAVPTNNAYYNFTGQTQQQLAITQLRAVEHGRPAVVASTSGISAVIGADGSVRQRSPEAESWETVAELPAMRGLTPATRLGPLPEYAMAAVGLAGVAVALWRTRRAPAPPSEE